MGNNWNKFKLLMWKNFTLQKRHKVQTAVEILAPVVFAALMVAVRSLVEPTMMPVKSYEPFSAAKLVTNSSIPMAPTEGKLKISYSPSNDMIETTIERSLKYLVEDNTGIPEILFNLSRFIDIIGYENSVALEQALTDPLKNDTSICGIQFDDSMKGATKYEPNSKLTLRFPGPMRMVLTPNKFNNWKTNFLFPPYQVSGPRTPGSMYGGPPSYVREGFSALSHSLLRQITIMIAAQVNETLTFPPMEIQRFPYPSYIQDDVLQALANLITLLILLSFVYTCINTVRVIAAEKELQLKEVMKIMGLPSWLHWIAWFIKTYSYLMVAIILIVILLKVEWYTTSSNLSGYSVFTYTPWHVLLVFLMVYMFCSVCFCFAISVFFSKANTAATVAGLMWFLSYAPYMFLANDKTSLPSLNARIFSSLASNTAMAYGFDIIFNYEATGRGLQWSDFFTPLTSDDTFVMGYVFIIFIVDAIIYMSIALYVEQIFPGSYGVPKPWYFLVSPDFWKSVSRSTAVVEDISYISNHHDEKNMESDPQGLKPGINISNLTKVFNKKTAVNNLNLKIFENQITVLLGHNGAGKTTTMSMLTGMFPPTSGTAVVAGHDIRTDMNKVRDSLGLCPQHNILFSDLTVAEHIYFYSSLKGVKKEDMDSEIDKYVGILDLMDKKDTLSAALSGGMKRRLNVGIALCGSSKVVLLDEPSSGMDPAARRHLWDLLHKEKIGRTVILTTHFMDEAEILGERVAIMSGGKLRAVGSPFYLKKKFGDGYRLIAARKPHDFNQPPAPAAPITDLLRSFIPQTKLNSDVGSEISYMLPDELSGQYEPMLKALEDKQHELGLISFGISASTLEEVFMRVGADAIEEIDENDQITYKEMDANGFAVANGSSPVNGYNDKLNDSDTICIDEAYYKGYRLTWEQWKVMLYKKMLVASRSLILGILQLFIPVLFLVIAILAMRLFAFDDDLPELDLVLSNGYEDSLTLINQEEGLSAFGTKITEAYKNSFEKANIKKFDYEDIGTESMSEYYIEQGLKDISKMRRRMLAGATVNKSSMLVWFSNFGYHELPGSLLLAHNAILQAFAPNYTLSLSNHPLPFTFSSTVQQAGPGDFKGFQISFNVGFSMAFVSAFFVLFYVKENVSRSKLLQYASGVSPSVLWGAAFLWDMMIFTIISLAICVTLAIAQEEGFATFAEIARIFFILILFGWSMLPLHYISSLFFNSPSTGYTRMCLFNIFTGLATFLVIQVLITPGLDLEDIGNALHWVFLIFPHYALCGGIRNLHEVSYKKEICQKICDARNTTGCNFEYLCNLSQVNNLFDICCIPENPYFRWESPGIGAHILYLVLTGFLAFAGFMFYEYKLYTYFWKSMHTPPPPIKPEEEDSDVAAERAYINDLQKDQYHLYNLLCKNMTKYYNKFLAVNQLSVGVKDNECFGLLGINGAGKTTTFKMLTGDLKISSGNAWVSGLSVNSDMKSVYKSIGYCPQFDALLDELTGRETLHIYSRLRGIGPSLENKYVWELSQKLGFVKHLDKKVNAYSGGNKRKLSTSLALLGDPNVVYLDEPTSGMDPMAKRQVWRAVSDRGCVILTSHSMEECEALCTRLTIMVNGQAKCLGSPQHLKNKFSQGYTLIIKLRRMPLSNSQPDILVEPTQKNSADGIYRQRAVSRNSSVRSLKMFDFTCLQTFINDKFPGAEVRESYQGLITYHIPSGGMMWSKMFGVLESAKDELNIEDYSIGQTSLEQIFLQFTKDQVSD